MLMLTPLLLRGTFVHMYLVLAAFAIGAAHLTSLRNAEAKYRAAVCRRLDALCY